MEHALSENKIDPEARNKHRSIITKDKYIEQEESENSSIKTNDAFCMDTYKSSVVPKISERKLDLFSGLNQTVKSINFNNVTEVTIHKRNREINDIQKVDDQLDSASNGCSDAENPKKKKYKIVPNGFQSPPQQFNSNSTVASSSTEKIERIENELPRDRKDLLKFVRLIFKLTIIIASIY